MKTSNKILLSFFALILLTITIILFVFRDNMNFEMAPDEGNFGKTEQQRNVSHFDKIKIESRFHVYYTQDTFQKVVVIADSNLIGLAVTEVNDGRLSLYSKKQLKRKQKIEVFVTTDSINDLQLNAGCSFKTQHKMKVYQLKCDGNAGSVLSIDGNFTNLKLAFNAGSVGNFSGSCKNLEIESNAGSVVNAGNLVAENGNVTSNAGSVTTINVAGDLSVFASAGSIVKYQGNPNVKNINISSGAQFTK